MFFRLCSAGIYLLFLLFSTPAIAPARAQDNHAQHHAFYKDWVNQQDIGCCNDQDCGALGESNERSTSKGTEVRIEGEWCPVESRHYLKKGNAPNWSTAHVCVVKKRPPWNETRTVCQRLLCYQPKPGT